MVDSVTQSMSVPKRPSHGTCHLGRYLCRGGGGLYTCTYSALWNPPQLILIVHWVVSPGLGHWGSQ